MRALGWVVGVVGVVGVAARPAIAQLAPSLDALFDAPPFEGMHVGALVVDAETGDVVYERNSGMRFVPASNQKLLTTIAALERLGPDYRFHTTIEAEGRLGGEGILVGDLVVRGSGDPTLSERWYDDAEAPLRDLAAQLWRNGVRRVRGDLVIDATAWDSTRIEGTWMWGDLPWGYAALGGPFVVADGMAHVEARAGAVGEPVSIRWWPMGDPDRFVSSARSVAATDDADLAVRLRPDPAGVEITGTLSTATVDTLQLSVQDPDREAAMVLWRLLGDRGIPVDGEIRVLHRAGGAEAAGATRTVLATLTSPPLIEIVEEVLEPSQNWMAEQLLHAIGAAERDRERVGAAPAGSEPVGAGTAGDEPIGDTRALRRILQSDFSIDSLDIAPVDGSGLSAYNLVTPRAVVELLVGVHARPWAAAYALALAEPGEDDSTLERRLDGLEGRVFAKTGTIRHVNSLSGYVDRSDGRRLVFSFLTNGSGLRSSSVRRVLDAAVRELAGEGGTHP